ncbi:MAG: monovalent cation/H+ antiporter complex subunit F [candidate division WOR-3 bacterium]|nr:monovalent cation/H+ antiporter complex subunit F [candidate division WOR-3 bacterium]MDW8113825.1 monovalent cation/H+ antiporter complex subunit F [candidate division WOR-3 bacterium]
MSILIITLSLAAFFSLYRALRGPSISDRAIAVDIMSILFCGITALMAFRYNLPYLLDLSITIAILAFIGTLALAKYLEGRHLDD